MLTRLGRRSTDASRIHSQVRTSYLIDRGSYRELIGTSPLAGRPAISGLLLHVVGRCNHREASARPMEQRRQRLEAAQGRPNQTFRPAKSARPFRREGPRDSGLGFQSPGLLDRDPERARGPEVAQGRLLRGRFCRDRPTTISARRGWSRTGSGKRTGDGTEAFSGHDGSARKGRKGTVDALASGRVKRWQGIIMGYLLSAARSCHFNQC